jgi:FkbM family methyltransferase
MKEQVFYRLFQVKVWLECTRLFGLKAGWQLWGRSNQLVKLHHPKLGYDLWVRPGTSDMMAVHEVLLKEEYKLPERFRAKFIVDLGASIGDSAMYFASRYPKARIVAVEMEESNFALLEKNIAGNKQIACIKAAAWYKKTKLKIVNKAENCKWAFRVGEMKRGFETNGPVETVTVMEIMRRFEEKEIDILKVDIEGAEKELFTANYSEWLPKTKVIMIELHDMFVPGSREAFEKALGRYNFEIKYKGGRTAVAVNKDFWYNKDII